ncbi:MAG: hypothetical protein DBY05_00975 [Clostridiales bacterium]|nr:MAG: hypothetical protein DBY05_00975 [Clostridiales bacterium]
MSKQISAAPEIKAFGHCGGFRTPKNRKVSAFRRTSSCVKSEKREGIRTISEYPENRFQSTGKRLQSTKKRF